MTKMGTYEKLHLANNLDALDLLAKRDCNPRNLKFQQICNALSKLYKTSQRNVLDQEKTYILLARYLNFYNYLLKSDKKFVELRFGSEYEKVLMQYEEIKRGLEARYDAESAKPTDKIPEEVVAVEETPQHVFNDEFINCQQLFGALQKKYNLLLVDARPDNDYTESRIDHPNCINVPDQSITAGLSANALGKKLPPESQRIWEYRETYDAIVLLDWNTNSESVALTKLNKLRSALVDWDLNRNYNEPPVILNGGYLELLQMYPTICLNPRVYLSQKNNELDELLELDTIVYPTESDNKSFVMGGHDLSTNTESLILPKPSDETVVTRESIIKEHRKIELSRHELLMQIEKVENEKIKISAENSKTDQFTFKRNSQELTKRLNQLQNLLADLDKQNENLEDKLKSHFQEELDDEPLPLEPEEPEIPEDDHSIKLQHIIDEQRDRELKRARALKPKNQNSNTANINANQSQETDKPLINRSTKPAFHSIRQRVHLQPVDGMHSGLVGLRNIRNTCYMNTAIQCFRNIPIITQTFCNGTHSMYNIRSPAAIIHETAGLVRQLWSSPLKSIEPYEFYNKVGQLEANYKQGNHEDCMEFFLFFLNHLAEDCCYDVPLPQIMTPRQRAWYNQFEGKNSIFRDWFYHQIRITQICAYCNQPTYKFEIESSFMLSVPEHDFYLEDLMNEYMDDYIIPEYCCAKCKKPVNNRKELCYEPEVMVIVLKRYKQYPLNGNITVKKIESKAYFPKEHFRVGHSEYELNAVVLHSGNLNFGHYTAAALTSNGWCEFNDEAVRSININDDSFKAKACAFFYSKCDTE